MTQWIDQPGPDDDPVVRVEDELGGTQQGGDSGGDSGRDAQDVDDVADGLAGEEPAKRHGDPLVPRANDARD